MTTDQPEKTSKKSIAVLIISLIILVIGVYSGVTAHQTQQDEEQAIRVEAKTEFLLSDQYQEYAVNDVDYKRSKNTDLGPGGRNMGDIYAVLLEDNTIIELMVLDTQVNNIYQVKLVDK